MERDSWGRVSYISRCHTSRHKVQHLEQAHGLQVLIPICTHLSSTHPSRGTGLEVRTSGFRKQVVGKAKASKRNLGVGVLAKRFKVWRSKVD